jgi:hypothetical protein
MSARSDADRNQIGERHGIHIHRLKDNDPLPPQRAPDPFRDTERPILHATRT